MKIIAKALHILAIGYLAVVGLFLPASYAAVVWVWGMVEVYRASEPFQRHQLDSHSRDARARHCSADRFGTDRCPDL